MKTENVPVKEKREAKMTRREAVNTLVAYACHNIAELPCSQCPMNKGRAVRCVGVTNGRTAEAVKLLRYGKKGCDKKDGT